MAQSMTNAAWMMAISRDSGDRAPAPSNLAARAFERDLIALIPHLRAFSKNLCRKEGNAEDIAQEALAKAWRARDRFEPGSNLKAWLFTILRHEFYSHMRRAWRETRWDDELGDQIPAPPNEQMWAMDMVDCTRAMGQLPDRQREALLLIGAGGFTYGEAADLLGTPIGSLKSRTARGRGALAKFFDGTKSLPKRSTTPTGEGLDYIAAQLTAIEGRYAANATTAER